MNRTLTFFPASTLLALALLSIAPVASAASRTQARATRSAPSAAGLSINEYIGQVRGGHAGYRGALETAAGAEARAVEGNVALAPQLFGSATFASDAKIPTVPVITYDKLVTNAYTLGVSKQFEFGLQAKLSYNLLYTNYDKPVTNGTAVTIPSTYEARPALELVMPLLGGGFGTAVRANRDAIEAAALARAYSSRYQARATLASAEGAYWRLALARQAVVITQSAVERAQKIQDWSSRRARLHLADRTDALQAEAALQGYQLSLQSARDEERAAARAFNSARGRESDAVAETLEQPDVERMQPPARAKFRDDVRAAEQQERATVAQATAAIERDRATLDVFANYALNGRKDGVGDSTSDSFSSNRPTQAVGVRFNYPLGGAAGAAQRGWAQEQAGANLAFQRQAFEQEDSWTDLSRRLGEARHRYALAQKIEEVQASKLDHERERLSSGRSTAFVVLTFQQDYSAAQLNRLRARTDIVSALVQMKTFSDAPLQGDAAPLHGDAAAN